MDRSDDEARIKALLARMRKAWREGDAAAYSECFTIDADYISFDGVRERGRAEIARAHHDVFKFMTGSILVTLETDTQFIHKDIARTIVKGGVLLPWQTSVKKGRLSIGIALGVRQANGDWLFNTYQNTRVNPQPVPKGVIGGLVKTVMRLMPNRTAAIQQQFNMP